MHSDIVSMDVCVDLEMATYATIVFGGVLIPLTYTTGMDVLSCGTNITDTGYGYNNVGFQMDFDAIQ